VSGRRRGWAGLGAVGAVLALVASAYVGGAAADAAPTPTPSPTTSKAAPIHTSTTFTIGVTQDVDSTNPFTGIAADAYEIYQLQYDTITGYAQKDFATTPLLAQSWKPSADGKTWTFKIRSGVKWSDGQPLTSADVAYTFNRVLTGTYEQTNYPYLSNVTKVVAPDPSTVVITTKKPTPQVYHLSIPILPEHIWSKISEKAVANYANEPTPGHPIVGSGPFMLTQVVKGQFVRMDKNPYYWGPPTHIDHLVFRVFNNMDSMAQALKRGEIDFADNLDPGVYNALKSDRSITTVDAKYSGFEEVAMNTGAALDDGTPIGNGNPALKDLHVRQAINYAIDRQTLVEKVYGGYGQAGTSIIPPLYTSLHYDPPASTKFTFNIAKANQILDQAGYTKGGNGLRKDPKTGKDLVLRLYGRSSSDTSQRTVQFVAGWLKQIGIQANVKMVSEDALTEFIGEGNYDLFEWGWVVEPDPDYQLSTFTCASRSYKDSGTIYANLSDSFYCNKAYDALYDKQAGQIDVAQRAATVKQMQKMLYDDAPYALYVYYDDLEAYRSDRWTNFRAQPAAGPDPTKFADQGGPLFFQYGTYSYSSVIPLSGSHELEGPTTAQAGGVVGGILVLWALGYGIARWRRPPQDEVE
jgi:peptide/nickel transport system substrate-binding protein